MEQPQQPEGGNHSVNSYGTDDLEEQARIEQARGEASQQRKQDRARLERHVDGGLDPDDAEAVVEFQHFLREQRAQEGGAEHAHPANPDQPLLARAEAADRPGYMQPRIYVASLADYNAGRLHGIWIDADQDPAELQQEIAAMLAESSEPVAEDWAIHDYEGFGAFRVAEFVSVEVISAVALGIAERGPAFGAYVSWAGTDEEALRAFDDCYLGSWPSVEAYARDMAVDFGWEAALRKLPEDLQPFVVIDYQQLARFVENTMTIVEGDGVIYLFSG